MLFPTIAKTKNIALMTAVRTVVMYKGRSVASNNITSRKKHVLFPGRIVPFDILDAVGQAHNTKLLNTVCFLFK